MDERFYRSWGFEDERTETEYMDTLRDLWRDPGQIPPETPLVAEPMYRLREHDDVWIVTNTPTDRELVDSWLDLHDVPYDRLMVRSPGWDKTQLDADRWVDDNPQMIDRTDDLLLVDQPYNRDRELSGSQERLWTIRDALFILRDQ